MTVTTARWLFS